MRRRNIKTVSLYGLLNGCFETEFNDPNISEVYKLVVVDDRVITRPDDFQNAFNIMDKYFPNKMSIVFKNLKKETYQDLVNTVKTMIVPNVSVINLLEFGKKVYRMDNQDTLVPVSFSVMPEDVFTLDTRDFGVIHNNSHYDRSVLDDKSFIRGLDSIVNQINFLAKNDVQKILLLDKMFKNNVTYDSRYIYATNPDEVQASERVCHKAQTVLRDRYAVCDAFSHFAAFVLNKVGIECKVISGMSDNEGHAWNMVKLGDEWYHCDFTFSLTADLNNSLRYILVSNPTAKHALKNGKKVILNTYDRNALKTEFNNIAPVSVLMPTYHTKDGVNYNIRRKAIVVEETFVPFSQENEPTPRRRTATLISEEPVIRKRRKAIITDKKD